MRTRLLFAAIGLLLFWAQWPLAVTGEGESNTGKECAQSGQNTGGKAIVRTSAETGALWLEESEPSRAVVAHFGEECCFRWVSRIKDVDMDTAPLEAEFVQDALQTPSRLITRQDSLPFYAGFDFNADRLSLRRPLNKYNGAKRYKMVAKQDYEADLVPLNAMQGLDNPRACAMGENKGVSGHLGYDSSWVYSANKGASFHFRYSQGGVVINVLQGTLAVLVAPPEDLTSLRPYPAIHPLYAHSSIDVKHSKLQNVSLKVVELAPGQRLVLPSLATYRFVPLENRSVWVVSDDTTRGEDLLRTKRRILDVVPKYLKPNALVGQPLFFGMWTLAIYFDGILKIDAESVSDRTKQRESYVELKKLLFDRWGPDSPRLGYADDYRDYGASAEEMIEGVEAECLEMRHSPKDLMLSQRDEVLEETTKASADVRKYLLQLSGNDTASNEFAFFAIEQMENAIADTLGGCIIRTFFQCYFGYTLTRD